MIRLVFAVALAAAGAVVAFDSSSLEARGWWTPPSSLVLWSIGIIALSVLWQFADAEIERRRVRRRTELANEINKIMFPVWYKIRTVTEDRRIQERIGVHVWMVPTWHWHLVPEWLRNLASEILRSKLPTPKMWRACHFRLKGNEVGGTDIKWTRDIGAIGRCWRERRRQIFVVPTEWGDVEKSAAEWGQMSKAERLGFSHAQYQRIREKYHSVLVIPIFKDPDVPGSRFIGCVVVDSLRDFEVDLNSRKVRAKAFAAGKAVSRRVAPIAS